MAHGHWDNIQVALVSLTSFGVVDVRLAYTRVRTVGTGYVKQVQKFSRVMQARMGRFIISVISVLGLLGRAAVSSKARALAF